MSNSLSLEKKILLYEIPILILVFFCLYALTSAQNFSAASDSNWLIYDIDHGNRYSPHHLLYIWFAERWIDLWRWIGSDADSAWIVQILNAVFGAMTMSIFYLVLRIRIRLNRIQAIIGTMLPAFSYGFWFYCTTIEVYIIPLFFLLLSFVLLSSKPLTPTLIALTGITHGLAILFHQMNVLFLPVVISAILINRELKSVPKHIVTYLATAVPVTVIPYLIVMVGILKLHTLPKIWHWLTLYSHIQNFWSSFAPTIFVKAVVGFGRTIIGGHFVLAASALQNLAKKIVGGKRLLDESFLVHLLGEYLAYVLIALSLLVICLLIVLVYFRIRFWRETWREHRKILKLLAVWIISYSIFFLFWDTSNIEFWIPQLVIFWLIIISLSYYPHQKASIARKSTIGLSVIAVLLLIINFAGSIQWLMHRNNDYYYVRTKDLAYHAARGDLIIIGRWWVLDYYLRRFTETDILLISEVYSEVQGQQAIDRINHSIQQTWTQGNKVLLSGEAVHLEPETIAVFGEGIVTFVKELWSPYRSSWTKIPSEIDTVYILTQN